MLPGRGNPSLEQTGLLQQHDRLLAVAELGDRVGRRAEVRQLPCRLRRLHTRAERVLVALAVGDYFLSFRAHQEREERLRALRVLARRGLSRARDVDERTRVAGR